AWHLYDLTHSPSSLGIVGLAGFVPVIGFSLVGGVVADKVDRKRLVVCCQAIVVALSAGLFPAGHTPVLAPWMIYLVVALASIARSFSIPASQALVVSLVPREIFINAVSLNILQRQTATILGPAIAGLTIAYFGVAWTYALVTAAFLTLMLV